MAKQSFQLDPNHTHNYRKLTRLGVDTKKDWSNPVWQDIVDDSDNVAAGATDIEAAGLTVSTVATETPN